MLMTWNHPVSMDACRDECLLFKCVFMLSISMLCGWMLFVIPYSCQIFSNETMWNSAQPAFVYIRRRRRRQWQWFRINNLLRQQWQSSKSCSCSLSGGSISEMLSFDCGNLWGFLLWPAGRPPKESRCFLVENIAHLIAHKVLSCILLLLFLYT